MTTLTKSVTFDSETGDFAMELDGAIVGYRRTRLQAETDLDAIAYAQLTHEAPVDAGELVGDGEAWEAVSAPRCELCEAPAVLVGEQWTCPECSPIGDEPALCCEHCGKVMSEPADAQLVGGELWCPGCVDEAEAARLLVRLTEAQAALNTAIREGREGVALALSLAVEDLMTQIAAHGYTAVNNGFGRFLLFRPAPSIVTVALPRAEAA